jgi:7-cyano-7-deazaguanine tRNA-ribosyltransferase
MKRFPDAQICSYSPFLGIIPAEISDVFPASHNVATRTGNRPEDYPTFVDSLSRYAAKFEQVALVGADDFMKQAVKIANLNVRIIDDISKA